MAGSARDRAAGLACWRGPVDPQPVKGGITNTNFVVEEAGERFFVRIGEDLPVHGVLRWNELAASRAAHAAGVSPEVLHAEPGALVLAFVEGRALGAEDVRRPEQLERIAELVRRAHRELARHLRGPALAFAPFHVIRDYARRLDEEGHRLRPLLPGLLARADELEQALGPTEQVFAHNDLLPANLIDDGRRLWLVDWDYAGWGPALFDLAGLASNCELSGSLERRLLEVYFDRPVDEALLGRHRAMKCVSLLREALWSMVSEHHAKVDFGYPAYTEENLARLEKSLAELGTS